MALCDTNYLSLYRRPEAFFLFFCGNIGNRCAVKMLMYLPEKNTQLKNDQINTDYSSRFTIHSVNGNDRLVADAAHLR